MAENGAEFLTRRAELNETILEIVHDLGGSFSAEHGIGLLKTAMIPRYKGEVAFKLMRSIKQAIDPYKVMNPGKVLPGD